MWRNNPSHGDNAATVEVVAAKWQNENTVESEVSRPETLFHEDRKGVGKQLIQPPFNLPGTRQSLYGEETNAFVNTNYCGNNKNSWLRRFISR